MMNFNFILSLVAALFTAAIAFFVLYKDTRPFIHRIFAAGMIAFALEAFLSGLIFQYALPGKIIHWYRWKMILTGFLPGIWLLFSMSFARGENRELIQRWRWLILCSFLVPLLLTTVFRKAFFIGEPVMDGSSFWMIRLGWSGYLFYLFFLLSAIFILMNLERALRWSIGHLRWQIKFLVFGAGEHSGHSFLYR